MKPLHYWAVTAQQVTTHNMPLRKLEWSLNPSAAEGLFVQVHDSFKVPAEGAVPLRSWPATLNGFKDFTQAPLPLSLGLYICLSSTDATKTLAVGASDTFAELQVELQSVEAPEGATAVTPVTGSTAGIDVWAHGDGRKQLLFARVVTGTLAATTYLLLCAVNGSTKVVLKALPLVASTTNVFDFGREGRLIRQVSSGGTECLGCSLIPSTSPTAIVAPADNMDFYAEYK